MWFAVCRAELLEVEEREREGEGEGSSEVRSGAAKGGWPGAPKGTKGT